MGCAASAPPHASKRSLPADSTAGNASPQTDQNVRAPDDCGDVPSPASAAKRPMVSFNAMTYTDYRGFDVAMANATASKMNFVCRWADAVLERRARHGGFTETREDVMAASKWDGALDRREMPFAAGLASTTSRCESFRTAPNRFNVSVHQTAGSSLRHMDKSQSSTRDSAEKPFTSFNRPAERPRTNLSGIEEHFI